jgi:hypothetical protein
MNNQHHTAPSWRRWLFIAFPSSLAAVLFALMLTLPASAESFVNTTIPLSLAIVNPCNGESVTVNGFVHDTIQVTLDDSGGTHVDIHDNFEDVSGIGSLGNTYQIPSALHAEANTSVGHENTFTETFNVITEGSTPNFLIHIDFHITVNPDGTVTSSHTNISEECH